MENYNNLYKAATENLVSAIIKEKTILHTLINILKIKKSIKS
jgi:hypothetical protein